MDSPDSIPWLLLIAGVALLVVARLLGQRTARLEAVLGCTSARPLTAGERRLPAGLGLIGAAWVVTFALMILPSLGHAKPFWAVVMIVVLLPATPVALIATAAWVLLRRTRRKLPA